jgi:6-pyruvoyltetrahydropterin/6-carboxytetrahydropterin synthase
MPWVLQKEFKFEAAHRLPLHDGKCARLHGHSWVGVVHVKGSEIIGKGPKTGMVMDYGDISAILAPIVETYLDHQFLNETLKGIYPTSEELAHWLYHELKDKISGLVAVEIRETCTASCTYSIGW